ncbi:hypothetical protein LVJ94_34190 [Pendulispora rubella]|uniref:MBL fold metallo-hydrolase n=1 Tax=Pendulispora rubella TaxID=2741070 RepID=A0ABZ2KTT0_9BACT
MRVLQPSRHDADEGSCELPVTPEIQRLLVEVDDYSPRPSQGPARTNPFASRLLDAVASRNLDIERVVPLHGRVASFAEFVATARSEKAE